jgi:phytoene dehydrogenase-like protein
VKFERRLQRLEERLERILVTETATLYFGDGKTAMIPWDRHSLGRLFRAESEPDAASPEDLRQLALVRRSVSSTEPGGGLIIELLASILEPE